jgi:hypothetical protein
MIKSAIEATTMQVITISRRGLQKAGRLSGGGTGEDAMGGWMQKARGCDFSFWCGGAAPFRGVLQGEHCRIKVHGELKLKALTLELGKTTPS